MKNIFFIIAAIILSFASYKRNLLWQNELSLCQDAAAKSHKWRTYCNLGDAYKKSGFTDDAIIAYKKALERGPECAPVHYSLGLIYHKIGSKDLVLQELKVSMEYADNYFLQKDDPIII